MIRKTVNALVAASLLLLNHSSLVSGDAVRGNTDEGGVSGSPQLTRFTIPAELGGDDRRLSHIPDCCVDCFCDEPDYDYSYSSPSSGRSKAMMSSRRKLMMSSGSSSSGDYSDYDVSEGFCECDCSGCTGPPSSYGYTYGYNYEYTTPAYSGDSSVSDYSSPDPVYPAPIQTGYYGPSYGPGYYGTPQTMPNRPGEYASGGGYYGPGYGPGYYMGNPGYSFPGYGYPGAYGMPCMGGIYGGSMGRYPAYGPGYYSPQSMPSRPGQYGSGGGYYGPGFAPPGYNSPEYGYLGAYDSNESSDSSNDSSYDASPGYYYPGYGYPVGSGGHSSGYYPGYSNGGSYYRPSNSGYYPSYGGGYTSYGGSYAIGGYSSGNAYSRPVYDYDSDYSYQIDYDSSPSCRSKSMMSGGSCRSKAMMSGSRR